MMARPYLFEIPARPCLMMSLQSSDALDYGDTVASDDETYDEIQGFTEGYA
jgi:hypothetical protein